MPKRTWMRCKSWIERGGVGPMWSDDGRTSCVLLAETALRLQVSDASRECLSASDILSRQEVRQGHRSRDMKRARSSWLGNRATQMFIERELVQVVLVAPSQVSLPTRNSGN
jgi:hypothetical protein